MASPPFESLNNNEARNTFWELDFFSRLKRANIQVSLGNPNPDILAYFGSRKYYIQCKRLYSPQQSALQKNISKAARQLEKDLSSEGSGAFGILAFSLERSLTEGKLMLVTDSEKAAREKMKFVLEEIRSRHGHMWQNPSLIRDPRIVAIVLRLVVPGIVRDENIFITGSQMDINNTWVSGAGFQAVMEDFGPLKQFFEY